MTEKSVIARDKTRKLAQSQSLAISKYTVRAVHVVRVVSLYGSKFVHPVPGISTDCCNPNVLLVVSTQALEPISPLHTGLTHFIQHTFPRCAKLLQAWTEVHSRRERPEMRVKRAAQGLERVSSGEVSVFSEATSLD